MGRRITILAFIVGLMSIPLLAQGQPLKTAEFIAEVGSKSTGTINVSLFRAQIGVLAYMKGNKEFKLQVISSTLIINRDEHTSFIKDNVGARFSDECQVIKERAQVGDKVIITNIKARGQDGIIRDVKPIALTLVR